MRIPSLAIATLALLAACASKPPATPIEQVRIVTTEQKAAKCKSLGEFTVNQRGGQDKQLGALQLAREEVAGRAGNGLLIISTTSDWMEGVLMTGEALQCQF